jgi:alpha-amylase
MKKLRQILAVIVLALGFVNTASADDDIMLQGFYWNSYPGGVWWDSLRIRSVDLYNAGFTAIWFPPPNKGNSGGYSMGYDIYDHYDFGEYNQKGQIETRFGSRAELISAIQKLHTLGMKAYIDIVVNHMMGGEAEETNIWGESRWTVFNYPSGSGRFKKNHNNFHPNSVHNDLNADWHNRIFGEDLCYFSGGTKDSLKTWGAYLTNVIGFDGYRIDVAKGIEPGFMAEWLGTAPMQGKFAVAEHWSDGGYIKWWHDQVESYGGFGANISMFDFPLRYALKDMCNGNGSYNMSNLSTAGLIRGNGMPGTDVSTFVENHDMDRIGYDGSIDSGHDPITMNKMMAYAYILFSEGYPCVWWRDYYQYGLSSQIKTLMRIRKKIVGGSTSVLYTDGDAYIAQRNGYGSLPGAVLFLNDGSSWRGVWVQTKWANTTLKDYTGQAMDEVTDANGWVEIWAPPKGYTVFAPGGYDINGPTISSVTASNINSTSATITWTTDEASNTVVEYGTTQNYGLTVSNASMVTSHSITLTGLTAGVTYYYQVKSTDAGGNTTVHSNHSFSTGSVYNYTPTYGYVTSGSSYSGSYSNLASDNGSYWTVKSTTISSYTVDWYGRVQISQAKANVAKITVTYNGKMSASRSQKLYLYNYSTSAWNLMNTTTVGTSDVTVTFSTTSTNYISSTGYIRLRVYATSTSGIFYSYGDYMKFAIETKGTSISKESGNTLAVRSYELSQNYPNPFNPTTVIKYNLPKEGKVTLKIYNLLGQVVRTLVDGEIQVGSHSVIWDSRNDKGQQVSSGIYIYRIQSGNFVKTKKMTLLK